MQKYHMNTFWKYKHVKEISVLPERRASPSSPYETSCWSQWYHRLTRPPTGNKTQLNVFKIKKEMSRDMRKVKAMRQERPLTIVSVRYVQNINSLYNEECPNISERITKLLDINFSVISRFLRLGLNVSGTRTIILLIWHLNCLLYPHQNQIYRCISTEAGNNLLVFSAFFFFLLFPFSLQRVAFISRIPHWSA